MSHGGNIHKIAAGLGRAEGEVMDLSASINPLGMPRGVKRAVALGLGDALHYPDPDNTALTNAISRRYGLNGAKVLCGNGSTELIYLLPRALKPRRVLIPYPTFSEYERASVLAGAEVVRFPLKSARDFLPDIDEMSRALMGVDMAFFCNPGNPSGKALGRGGVMGLIKAAQKARCLLVVDEAFMEFAPEHSVLNVKNKWLLVLRSLTKFYGLAGLRSGFCTSTSTTINRLRQAKEPWSVNVLAQRASVAALDDGDFAKKTLKYLGREKAWLEREFESLGLRHFPSDVNYYLIESLHAPLLIAGLLERSIAVRECTSFRGLGRRYLRAAVRTRRENRAFINAMSEILGEVRG